MSDTFIAISGYCAATLPTGDARLHQRTVTLKEKPQLLIYLANVGANLGHRGLFSPLFADRTFEFVLIPSFYEDPDL